MMKWQPRKKAYFRQGVALQYLGRHADALAAFASGLAQDPKSLQLLVGMVEAAMKSPMRDSLEPTYQRLQGLKLERSPFVVVAVVGQELLAAGHYASSAVVLEAALRIGSPSLRLRGSVFSALSCAHWALGDADKSAAYMRQDLAAARALGDQAGECRAHGNLGSAHFSRGDYREALANHRQQLMLAMKLKDREAASSALTSLGHVYTSIGDHPNALASHKQCVLLARQGRDRLSEARELGNVGAVQLALGDFEGALRSHERHLELARALGDRKEEARAYSNLGSAYHFRRDFDKAASFHGRVLELARSLGEKAVEMRAYAGLGHAARGMHDLDGAQRYHRQQLALAQEIRDRAAEGRASSNLGIILQMKGDFEGALKLHQAHLSIAQELRDYAAQGRAYGNLGNAYSALGSFERAVQLHRQELQISVEVHDRQSQASTHGNLAVAYQALGAHDRALQHYRGHLRLARELRDAPGLGRALANLGSFHGSRGEFEEAARYFREYLRLAPQLQDLEGEGKACHGLGYALQRLGRHEEAAKYYEQDLALARDLRDKLGQARAYCNLGLALKATGEAAKAEECQAQFLALARSLGDRRAEFRALGNLGDLALDGAAGDAEAAVRFYEQQLELAVRERDRRMEASACAALGAARRTLGAHGAALGYHERELEAWQELGDADGERRCHGRRAAVHAALGQFGAAAKCREEELEAARRTGDAAAEAEAHGGLGLAKMGAGAAEEAVGCFERQLAALQGLSGSGAALERGRAFGNLGSCYAALGDHQEALKCYEEYLSAAQGLGRDRDQAEAYRGLGNAHRALGSLQQALVCLEKRLVAAHGTGGPREKAEAYGELGHLHGLLGNYEQAASCLERQLALAREAPDRSLEGEAASGLGRLHQRRGDPAEALRWHGLALRLAEEAGDAAAQGRAYGGLGLAHEALGALDRAVRCQEQRLGLAAQTRDPAAKAEAYAGLGRAHRALRNFPQAAMYFREGLRLAEQLGLREDEARIRHGLGLSLWSSGNLEEAQHQLLSCCFLLEGLRRESRLTSDCKPALFALQDSAYRALQRILLHQGRPEEALAVAERGRRRAFADLLVERQSGQRSPDAAPADPWVQEEEDEDEEEEEEEPWSPAAAAERLLETVSGQQGLVIYYSLAAGRLHSWLLAPGAGILKFHESLLGEGPSEDAPEDPCESDAAPSALERLLAGLRQTLALEPSDARSETESDSGDSEETEDRRTATPDPATSDPDPFLRMVSRNNRFNRRSQSAGGGSPPSPGCRFRGSGCPLRALYDLLIAPLESGLLPCGSSASGLRPLTLVLEGPLFLVPFALLKGNASNEFLCERFALVTAPSLRNAIGNVVQSQGSSVASSSSSSFLVVSHPLLPCSVADRWGVRRGPSSEDAWRGPSEALGVRPLSGPSATKARVLAALPRSECVHFATPVAWGLTALVLAPDPDARPPEDPAEGEPEPPPLGDFLLTAADVLGLRLSAVKLVALGPCPESPGRVTAEGLQGLAGAFLASGVRCVLAALWPGAAPASTEALLRGFYRALRSGATAGAALSGAMAALQRSKDFAHPAHWAGFTLIGRDVKLTSPSSLIGQALTDILRRPDRARDALRVLLHLVEKSLQRIQSGQRNAMYTSQQSVERKVGSVPGWRELLTAVGFRLDPPAAGLPAAVFFPTSDPGDRLQQCSATLQALLGLPVPALEALSKLVSASESGEQLINRLHQVLVQLQVGEKEQDLASAPIQVSISVQLWRLPGCHEFLAALGFDLCEVGQEEVALKTGKQAGRRTMHFALQALLALFDSTELPKRLSLDSSSSLESLASAQSSSNPGPIGGGGGHNPPFSPTDGGASDAVSLYSLSSVASAAGFAPRTRETRKNQNDDGDGEGNSTLNNETSPTYRFPPGDDENAAAASSSSSSSSPSKPASLVPSPNSPFQKVGRRAAADADSDRSNRDGNAKSQGGCEDGAPNLNLPFRTSETSAFRFCKKGSPDSPDRPESVRDVAASLNLSPRRGSEGPATSAASSGGRLETKDFSDGPRRMTVAPRRMGSGNGYKFLSPGRFFPSSKC